MHNTLVSSIGVLARSRLATIGADASLADVANLLSDTHISLVVVRDSDGVMVGVISKTDIVQEFGRHLEGFASTKAADVMSRDVSSCRPTTSLPDVLSLMEKRGFVHIPVVDESSKPVGVVNAGDALRALLAEGKLDMAHLRDYVMGVGYR